MTDIRARLKQWWQGKHSGAEVVELSQDVLQLFRLRREHRLLRLKFAGMSQSFQSLLLEVDLKRQRLLLDEPFPVLTEGEWYEGRPLEVVSMEGTASTRFETRVQGLVSHEGFSALAVAMPVAVHAAQRRRHYRLEIQKHMPVQAVLRLEPFGNLAATVLDLSVSGVRLQVPSLAGQAPLQSAPFYLRLGSEPGILCTVRVCNLQHGAEWSVIGGELVGLNPQQHQLIERFIARHQRLQRQREMALAF